MANQADNILKTLRGLEDSIPRAAESSLKQKQAARDLIMQQALGSAEVPAGTSTQRLAQQVAPTQVAEAGQLQAQTLQQAGAQSQEARAAILAEQQRRAQLGLAQRQLSQQERLQQQELAQQTKLRQEEIASRKEILDEELRAAESLQTFGIEQDNRLQTMTRKQREDLAKLGRGIKEQLADSRLQFEKDDRGRKFSNIRQLADYSVGNARTSQEAQENLATIKRTHDKNLIMLKDLQQSITDILNRGFKSRQGDLDRQTRIELQQLKNDLEATVASEKNKAANISAISQGIFKVAVAYAGA